MVPGPLTTSMSSSVEQDSPPLVSPHGLRVKVLSCPSSCPSTAHHTCHTPAPARWSFSPGHTCLWLSSTLRRNLSSLTWPPRPRHPLQPHFPLLSPQAAWSPHSPTPCTARHCPVPQCPAPAIQEDVQASLCPTCPFVWPALLLPPRKSSSRPYTRSFQDHLGS